jgi:hypothetical protein
MTEFGELLNFQCPDPSGTPPPTLDQLLEMAGLKVTVGLRQQDHLGTVHHLRKQGHAWADIGARIGWSPEAVQNAYEIELRERAEGLESFVRYLAGTPCTCEDAGAIRILCPRCLAQETLESLF